MSNNDYLTGPHHFWTHFWCGLVVGIGLGSWWGSELFDGGWKFFLAVVVVALFLAYSCGRWGDRFWRWLIERLPWFT